MLGEGWSVRQGQQRQPYAGAPTACGGGSSSCCRTEWVPRAGTLWALWREMGEGWGLGGVGTVWTLEGRGVEGTCSGTG